MAVLFTNYSSEQSAFSMPKPLPEYGERVGYKLFSSTHFPQRTPPSRSHGLGRRGLGGRWAITLMMLCVRELGWTVLKKNDTDFQFCVWVCTKIPLSLTTGTRITSGKGNKAGEARKEEIRRNLESRPPHLDLMWWERKIPRGVSKQGSDVMKTVIKEDEMQAGQIKGRD